MFRVPGIGLRVYGLEEKQVVSDSCPQILADVGPDFAQICVFCFWLYAIVLERLGVQCVGLRPQSLGLLGLSD